MPAQLGGSILLQYGQQGAQQPGGTLILEYVQEQTALTVKLTATTRAPWSQATYTRPSVRGAYTTAIILDEGTGAPWGQTQPLDESDRSRWAVAKETDDRRGIVFDGPPVPLDQADTGYWVASVPRDDQAGVPWGGPMVQTDQTEAGYWRASKPTDDAKDVPWGGPMIALGARNVARFPKAAPGDWLQWIPWLKYSRTLNPGWGVVTPNNPVPDPGEPVIILPARYYIVINESSLLRSADNTAIECFRMSIQYDVDSWLPSFSAEIPGTALSIVEPSPDPIEVTAAINGFLFKFLVENIARSRRFGQNRLTISGRNPAAVLGDPYAPQAVWQNAQASNAQQLVNLALTNTDYTVEWAITDWLVTAGAFKEFGPPIKVAQRVAEAAGAVLVADREEPALRFLPRYPTAPWEWAGVTTPDYTLPTSLALTEAITWAERPAYNRVFVSGVDYGIIGNVKRTGTAGDIVAPLVTDSLITAEQVARQRGTAILADTGRKAMLQLSLPVPEDLGPLDLSKLVAFGTTGNYRRGLTRAVAIDVTPQTIRQTVTIEAAA